MTAPSPRPGAGAGSQTTNTMRDVTVHGAAIQAGSITGGVHVHHNPVGPPTPWQVRPVPASFTDRTEDLDGLTSWIRGRSPYVGVVAVHGPPGVGKSTLAQRLLDELRDEYPGGQLYVDLRGYDPAGPVRLDEALGRLLRSLYGGALPSGVEERAAWWRSVTAERSRRPVAVLVDNAVHADQVRALLPGGRDHLLVVTSRLPLTDLGRDGARHHHLHPFSPTAAQEYLAAVAGEHRVAGDRRAAHAIASLGAGLPLSLALAGSVLASHPERSLAELAAALTERREQVSASPHGLTPLGVAMTSSLDETYWGLPRPRARVFRSMGHLFPRDVDAAVTAAVCGLTPEDAEQELSALAGAGLLITMREDAIRGTVYSFHDEVHAYARHRAVTEATDGELDEQTRRALDFYLATITAAERLLTDTHRRLARDYRFKPDGPAPFSTKDEAAAWLHAQSINLMPAVRTAAAAALPQTCWQLVHALWAYLRLSHDHALWGESHQLGLTAARECGDQLAEQEMLNTWGIGMRGDNQFEAAVERFEQVLQIARAGGDRRGEAQALHEIGSTYLAADRPNAARPPLEQGRALRQILGAEATDPDDQRVYTRAVALSDTALGQVAISLGDAAGALSRLASARTTLLDLQDDLDAARALAWLARAHALAGDLDAAEREGRQAVAECTAIRSARWTARSLELLGRTLREAGRDDQARDAFEQSLQIYTALNPRDADRVRRQLPADA
ncbi:tetratricopeptide repeat protein [Streptomyces tropicalis]|uniref:Tetratricopeptide repeat protein n=1 Tax=Streptomyces tropicalis TaxID=3034234 RepID=A0ABT6AEX6_9ACTN|nr:tetratricopeptide repeat protein [Streptomyces tropicalis]MDF3303208.1 tetratricopeptide repeat protein [Streptomyces tropicalis]